MEEVFFVINENNLVLDKVLVEYNEAPIFFVCKDERNYFISSCIDIEEERYIVVEVTLSRLSKMLHEKITMREVILQANKFWDVRVGEDVTKDEVAEKNIREIPLNSLPYEGAFLKIATRDLENYAEKIDSHLYGKGVWENKTSEMFEYVNIGIWDFMEQYKADLQCSYESVIKENRKKDSNSNYDKLAYDKNLCISDIKIDFENVKINIPIAKSSKYRFAA